MNLLHIPAVPRRALWVPTLIATLLTAVSATAQDDPQPQSRAAAVEQLVIERARQLAADDFGGLPTTSSSVADMDYQDYRSIRFKPEEALWRGESLFELQLFHTGFLYNYPVQINLVDSQQGPRRLPFDSNFFRYDDSAARFADTLSKNAGYAGFRVHYPLNTVAHKDEVVVFQGASYFRLVGPGQVYGISARGLAIDTAESSGEEFPVFREFWLIQPEEGESRLTLFALLDSPSVTGAYRFELSPDIKTHLDVTAHIFPRTDIKKLGVAPLTSMFLYGENRTRFFDDFRPEVHDSDGLLMHTANGEWIWRPLTNPRTLHVTSLQDENPRGFGLLQRDRKFDNYLDSEADYQDRPSLWIEPRGNWGAGRVELVEIPTKAETNDNIVAYWVPREPVTAGQELSFSYRITAFDDQLAQHELAQVVRTRIGWSALPGADNPPPRDDRQFVVDFAGEKFASIDGSLPVKAHLEVSSGEYRDLIVVPLPDGGWRAAFKLEPEGDDPVDMRLHIALRDKRLSEVWNYVWYPDSIR